MINFKSENFKIIKNKSIPNTMRPKFRSKTQSNIYFLSQRKVKAEKKLKINQHIKLLILLSITFIGGYFFTI
jgi:hypothetical protein|tara:strand:- start:939 stop:1154 length:216 start_codon:yes stop_codon:yes gene_type:complete